MNDRKDICEILHDLRKFQKLSKQDLAKIAKVSTNLIREVENEGFLPETKTIEKLATAMGSSIDQVLSGNIRPKKIQLIDESKINTKLQWEKEEKWAIYCQKFIEKCKRAIIDQDILAACICSKFKS
jgi:transcriptional regulator with XRE-family HTH domain